MAQVLFATDTTPSLVDLDANFKEGAYSLHDLVSTPAHGVYSAYTATNQKLSIDASGNMTFGSGVNSIGESTSSGKLNWISGNGNQFLLWANRYFSVSNKYSTIGYAGGIEFDKTTGAWSFNVAPSGSADAVFSPTTVLKCDSSGNVLATSSGIGYGTGAGGTVTQATSKSTGVTLNKACGQITMNAASLAASTAVSFTLTNSTIAATDQPDVSIASGATAGAYVAVVDAVSAGSCRISLRNLTGGALAEAVVMNFVNTKAVTA